MSTVGRNDPCPCGSGKKYKKCCEAKNQAAEYVALEKKHAEAVKTAAAEAEKKKADDAKSPTPTTAPTKAPSAKGISEHRRNTFVTPKFNAPRRTGGG